MKKANSIPSRKISFFFISLLPLIPALVQANEFPITPLPPVINNLNVNQPAISIIIDDMGYRLKSGQRAVNLPGDLTYSFLPHAPHVNKLSQNAHEQNKEVMLHLPMEAEAGKKLGPGGLTECMTEKKFNEVLLSSINSIPHVSGFNNHMGSLLTKSPLWMKRLMQEVAMDKKLFFVDSKTTSDSVAHKVASAEGLNSIQRDIFIDHEDSKIFIQKQLRKLIQKAQQNGTALAIAHPKEITLSELEKWLPELESKGIKLVSVSKLISLRQQRKLALWKKPAQQ
ncbi:MAG: divergent polysaccharide deacetylase family protein [Gammaproteobacteria bacterium]|nr:divergent polysaccharide deacetylase family protein [Gammaproteobacteria bacterium]MCW9031272.1 divergent polysaccharide deacetylase family protein [Gammaproteobacteria bacterium]